MRALLQLPQQEQQRSSRDQGDAATAEARGVARSDALIEERSGKFNIFE